MISFEFDNKIFTLEFTRKIETVEIYRGDNKVKQIQSKYPYTQVKLYMLPKTGGAVVLVQQAKVGCAPFDLFSHAKGRLEALRVLSRVMRNNAKQNEELKRSQRRFSEAMWDAYQNRGKQVKKQQTPIPQQEAQAS